VLFCLATDVPDVSPRSRRAVLAATGSALVTGCFAGTTDDAPGTATRTADRTASPTDVPVDARTPDGTDRVTDTTDTGESVVGPEPLGYEAVPDGSTEPDGFERERVYERDEGRDAVAATARPDGLSVLLYDPRDDGEPVLLHTDRAGRETARRALGKVPTNEAYFLERVGDTTVVGGMDTTSDPWTWLQGYRDGEVVFEWRRDEATTYAALAAADGDLLAAGTTGWGSSGTGRFDAVLTRLDADGNVRRELTVDEPDPDARFWTVTPTDDGVLAGGSRGNEVWLVSVDGDGSERWRRTVPREGAYTVHHAAVGDTETYALARTEQFATGNNHLLLLSLGDRGEVEWTRVFDPNRGADERQPRELYGAGVVGDGGSVLAGRTERRTWLAATDPDGAVRWAGYRRYEGQMTRPVGSTIADGRLLLHGSVGSPAIDTAARRPWLAWFDPA
jgi:hypothetical protein